MRTCNAESQKRSVKGSNVKKCYITKQQAFFKVYDENTTKSFKQKAKFSSSFDQKLNMFYVGVL